MGGRGKAASNAGSSGRHERTDSTPRTPWIGPDIEARAGGHEAQIMNTKSAREEAFLDTLTQLLACHEPHLWETSALPKTGNQQSMDMGHYPMLSQPEELTRLLLV
jgi:hypothetical protein